MINCFIFKLWRHTMNFLTWRKVKPHPTTEAPRIGINRLCSATFEQLLAFWATLCSTSNLGQLLPSLATFEQQIDIKPIQTIKGRFISKDFIKTGFIKTDFMFFYVFMFLFLFFFWLILFHSIYICHITMAFGLF